jgi:hypothetical protein
MPGSSRILEALASDPDFLDVYLKSDPYMAMAIKLGDAPAGATKATHYGIRTAFKTAMLDLQYGHGDHWPQQRSVGRAPRSARFTRCPEIDNDGQV